MRSVLLRKTAKPADDLLIKRYGPVGLDADKLAVAKNTDDGDYLEWVIKQWLKNQAINLPEDQDKIKKQLHIFTKLKRSPRFEGSKDINSYTPQSLFKLVAEKGETEVSVADQDRSAIVWTGQGANEFISGKIEVYKPKSIEQLMRIGGGPSYTQQGEAQGITNWCTTQEYQAQRYFSAGPMYIVKVNGKNLAQYSPSTDDLMDGADDPLETISILGLGRNIIKDPIVNLALSGAEAPNCQTFHIFHGDKSPIVEQLAYYSAMNDEVKYEAVFAKIGKDPQALAFAMYEDRNIKYTEENEEIIAKDPEAAMCAVSYYMNYGHSARYIEQYPLHMNTIMSAVSTLSGNSLFNLAKDILHVLPTTGDFLVERLVEAVDESGGKYAMDLLTWYKNYLKMDVSNHMDPETTDIVEDCLVQYPNPAARYAIDVLEERWPSAESRIINGVRLGEYMIKFHLTPWPEMEPDIAKGDMVAEYMRTLCVPVLRVESDVSRAIAGGYKLNKAVVARLNSDPGGLSLLYKYSTRFEVEIDGVPHRKLLENEAEFNSSINSLSRKLEDWLDDHPNKVPRNPDLEYLFSYVSDQQMDPNMIVLGDRDDHRLSEYMALSEDDRLHKYRFRSDKYPRGTFQRFIHAIKENPIK